MAGGQSNDRGQPPGAPDIGELHLYGVVRRDDGETYLLLFDDSHVTDAHKQLGRWASNPDLSFDWFDAGFLADRIRRGITK